MTRVLLIAGAVLLIGIIAVRQISRMRHPPAQLWVAARTLAAGQRIVAADLKQVTGEPVDGAIAAPAEIVGRLLLQPKRGGEAFVGHDLSPVVKPLRLSSTIPSGRLLATLQVDSMDLPVPELTQGDRLDVLQATSDGVRVVAHDAYMMGLIDLGRAGRGGDSGKVAGIDISIPGANTTPAPGQALVLAVYPAEVYGLTAAEAGGPKVKIVLHSAAEVQANAIIDLRPPPAKAAAPRPKPASVELLHGTKSETVTFQ